MSESVIPKQVAAEAKAARMPWPDMMAYYQVLAIQAHTREMGRIADALEVLAARQTKPSKAEEER